MRYLDVADPNAPYKASIDDPEAPDFEPETWGIWDRYDRQIFGSLNEDEAQRIVACLNYCQRLTSEQLEQKVKQGRIPTR